MLGQDEAHHRPVSRNRVPLQVDDAILVRPDLQPEVWVVSLIRKLLPPTDRGRTCRADSGAESGCAVVADGVPARVEAESSLSVHTEHAFLLGPSFPPRVPLCIERRDRLHIRQPVIDLRRGHLFIVEREPGRTVLYVGRRADGSRWCGEAGHRGEVRGVDNGDVQPRRCRVVVRKVWPLIAVDLLRDATASGKAS